MRARISSLSLGAALLALAAIPASADPVVDRANRGLVEIATSSTFGTDARMMEDLADLLDDGQTRRIVPMIGKGSLQNLFDLKVLRGIDVAVVQWDVLENARAEKRPPGIEYVTYIAKLYNEEFHLLARPDVKTIGDLAGKKVNLGVPGDGTVFTGEKLLAAAKVKVQVMSYPLPVAFDKLRSGEISALAYVAAKPAPLFAMVRPQDGLHLVSIPLKPELAANYVPARFTSEDYPDLVASGASVDTVAVGAVLVVANLLPESERNRNVANFVDAFFTQFPKLLEPGHHPKWNEVNLAAELPNWRRYSPAETWIKRNGGATAPATVTGQQLRDIFAKFLDERTRASGATLTAQQKDELFGQFKRWQEGKVR
ncbi:MAG TPA: TAXI family TRAP transporter solute-binding subunit [Thermoanaerobaculia bacterium]|nr:TAXI family TRAP transporter solute-binding subunit [Thermoanaerobaculia bacterium]